MVDSKTVLLGGVVGAYLLSQSGGADPGGGSGGTDGDGADGGGTAEILFTSDGRFGTVPVDITLRQSENLTDANGRVPERMGAKVLQMALDDAQRDYNIRIGFPTENPPSELAGCSGDDETLAVDWFRQRVRSGDIVVGNDANMLLTNPPEIGGCAAVLGKYGVMSASYLTDIRSVPETAPGSDLYMFELWGILHEVGHQLGAEHAPDDDPRPEAFAGAWIEGGALHITPAYGGGGFDNVCGDFVPKLQTPIVRHFRFSECMAQYMVVR